MNKKQAGIIVTLLALIVCAGILAAKVNGPLEVTSNNFDEKGGVLTFNKDNTTATTTTDYFANTRLDKEQADASALATLRTIVDNDKLKAEEKQEAVSEYTALSKALQNEDRIEQLVKGLGFEDAICYIEDEYTKARIIVKATEISPQQTLQIKDIVKSTADIMNVEVALK